MCGLRIELEGEPIRSIRGDPDDPFSKGFVCPKATALEDVHLDPDRQKHPLRRTAEGWARIGWDEAFDEVVDRLAEIQARHGPDSVALYLGNPNVHSLGAMTHGLAVHPRPPHAQPLLGDVGRPAAAPPRGHDDVRAHAAAPHPGHRPDAVLPRPRRQSARLQRQHDDRARDAAPAQGAEGARRPAGGRRPAAHRDRRSSPTPTSSSGPAPTRCSSPPSCAPSSRSGSSGPGRLAEFTDGPRRGPDRGRALRPRAGRRPDRHPGRADPRHSPATSPGPSPPWPTGASASPPRRTAASRSGSSRCSTSSPGTSTAPAARSSPGRR